MHYEGLCPSAALDDILLMNEAQFAETLSMLTENQKRVLAANVETRGLKRVSSGRANIFRSYFDMGLK